MSTSYQHLTINEREKIMILLAQGKKQAEIAKALDVAPAPFLASWNDTL